MNVPVAVMNAWKAEAESNQARQVVHHVQRKHQHPAHTCWNCGRARAVCSSKRRYDDFTAAQARCDEMNTPDAERLVVVYRCYWAEGLHWHVTTAKNTARRRRARKRMGRLLRETA